MDLETEKSHWKIEGALTQRIFIQPDATTLATLRGIESTKFRIRLIWIDTQILDVNDLN